MLLSEFISGDPDPGINYVIPKIWYNQVKSLQEEQFISLSDSAIPPIQFDYVTQLDSKQYQATFESMMKLTKVDAATKTVSPPMLLSAVYDEDYDLISSNSWRQMLAQGIKSTIQDITIGMILFLVMDYPEEESQNPCLEIENFIVPSCRNPIRLIIQSGRNYHFHLVYLPGHLYLPMALQSYIRAQGYNNSGYYCFPLINSNNLTHKQLNEILISDLAAKNTLIVYNEKEMVEVFCHQNSWQSNVQLPRQNSQLARIFQPREKSNEAVASDSERFIRDFQMNEKIEEVDLMINTGRDADEATMSKNSHDDAFIFYQDGVEERRKFTDPKQYKWFEIGIGEARKREEAAYTSTLIDLPTETEMGNIISSIISSIKKVGNVINIDIE